MRGIWLGQMPSLLIYQRFEALGFSLGAYFIWSVFELINLIFF